MELRKTEEMIQSLVSTYVAIRQSIVLKPDQVKLLAPLPSESYTCITPATPPPPSPVTDENSAEIESDTTKGDPSVANVATEEDSKTKNAASPKDANTKIAEVSAAPIVTTVPPLVPDPSTGPAITDMEALITTLEFMEETLRDDGDLASTMDRFRTKLDQVDAVTRMPRYGPKSHARVQRMLAYFGFLKHQHVPPHSNSDNDCVTSPSLGLFQDLRKQFHLEQQTLQQTQASEEQAKHEEQMRQEREQQEQMTREKALAEEKAAQRAATQQAEAERLRQQAEMARQRRLNQEAARRQAEQRYLDSILKGVEGVKHYVTIIKESTASDPAAQSKAFASLHTLFDQILKHPEETNFRKIRQNHPGFHQDIGRHKGSIELLIAAGFRPKMLPDATFNNSIVDDNVDSNADVGGDLPDDTPMIACLVSKEPNLEVDMDGWSQWYDLKKATLEILQKESGSKR